MGALLKLDAFVTAQTHKDLAFSFLASLIFRLEMMETQLRDVNEMLLVPRCRSIRKEAKPPLSKSESPCC